MADLTTSTPSLEDGPPTAHGLACASCGAPLETLDKFCTACGTPNAASEVPPPAQDAPAPLKHIRCENCGAEVQCDPGQRSYACPFCESTYVVEFAPDTSDRQPPEFVIGFAIPAEKAQEAFQRWLGEKSWFRPGDLKRAQVEEKLRGVYLPFWAFSMLARSRWSAQIGEYWYRTETYTTVENGKTVTRTRQVRETEWWPLAGQHHKYYSGYLVSGSRGLPQQVAEGIKPFHLAACKRYQPFYLAGWLCEEYSVAREAAQTQCQAEFAKRAQQDVGAFLPGDTHSGLNVQTAFSDINSDLVLLPIYLLTYKHGGKLYRFLLNGQTGKAAGDKPLSWLRILAAVGAAALLVAIIVLVVALLQR